MLELNTLLWSGLDPEEQERLLERPVFHNSDLQQSVTTILGRVRAGGDAALAELTLELDGTKPERLSYGPESMDAAVQSADPDLIAALEDASGRIRTFHTADLPRNNAVETAPGLICEVRYQALSPVGLYIPGGSAPLVSTVLMLAIPAALAGCAEIVMCSPPGRDGKVAAEILVAARVCGVSRVFCAGGAQAIAAMAYGSETIPKCTKIFGPGNAWVTEAKQQVARDPKGAAIDLPAGPSELLVIADASANAEFVAWDLLSQAEHGPDSQVVLLTDSKELADTVIGELQQRAPLLPRVDILKKSLAECRIIQVNDMKSAIELSNRYAPEHLIINATDAARLAEQARNAGSVFIGPWTPESLGDYCSGTNHVLPTYGWARSHGALGMSDFMRRMTLQQASPKALLSVGPTAEKLASIEGLDAHRMAVTARLQAIGKSG
jgi:histidinol dehydrogenase